LDEEEEKFGLAQDDQESDDSEDASEGLETLLNYSLILTIVKTYHLGHPPSLSNTTMKV
jgi:hypothetical protein